MACRAEAAGADRWKMRAGRAGMVQDVVVARIVRGRARSPRAVALAGPRRSAPGLLHAVDRGAGRSRPRNNWADRRVLLGPGDLIGTVRGSRGGADRLNR